MKCVSNINLRILCDWRKMTLNESFTAMKDRFEDLQLIDLSHIDANQVTNQFHIVFAWYNLYSKVTKNLQL